MKEIGRLEGMSRSKKHEPASVAFDEVVSEALLRALSGLLFLSTAFATLFAAISLDAAWPLCFMQ